MRLTHKSSQWDWSSLCQHTFDSLKNAFTSAPVLSHWQPNSRITIETDTSDYAIAAIMSISPPPSDPKSNSPPKLLKSDLHPIVFHSRTLNLTELNYDTHDEELLAIFEVFKVWQHYLEGSEHVVNVVTDHKNLKYFTMTKMLTRQQARWSEYLSSFNILICFHPGRLGTKPDVFT